MSYPSSTEYYFYFNSNHTTSKKDSLISQQNRIFRCNHYSDESDMINMVTTNDADGFGNIVNVGITNRDIITSLSALQQFNSKKRPMDFNNNSTTLICNNTDSISTNDDNCNCIPKRRKIATYSG